MRNSTSNRYAIKQKSTNYFTRLNLFLLQQQITRFLCELGTSACSRSQLFNVSRWLRPPEGAYWVSSLLVASRTPPQTIRTKWQHPWTHPCLEQEFELTNPASKRLRHTPEIAGPLRSYDALLKYNFQPRKQKEARTGKTGCVDAGLTTVQLKGKLSCSKEKLSRHFGLLSGPTPFRLKGLTTRH